MIHYIKIFFFLFFLLQSGNPSHAKTSPRDRNGFNVKMGSNQPAPRIVLLMVRFKQGEEGVTAQIIEARLTNGTLKQEALVSSRNKTNGIICYLYNGKQQIVDSLKILQPLIQQYEYPKSDTTMDYRQVEFKEQYILLRFRWQPGLKSILLYQHGNNKSALAPQQLLLPVSITQPN